MFANSVTGVDMQALTGRVKRSAAGLAFSRKAPVDSATALPSPEVILAEGLAEEPKATPSLVRRIIEHLDPFRGNRMREAEKALFWRRLEGLAGDVRMLGYRVDERLRNHQDNIKELEPLRQAGAVVDVLPSHVYFKSMAQAILAADETIDKNPQLIQKLVRATLKGMKDIMANPRAAAMAYVAHVPAHKGKEASIEKMFQAYKWYVYAGQRVPGQMDVERLADLQKFYVTNGVVPKAVPVAELYTNQFVSGK